MKRTGIAVTDPLRMIASGLCTQPTEELMDFLKSYLSQEDVDTVVFGQPRRMDHSLSAIESDILAFIERFRRQFPRVGVVRQDERFTSKIAMDAMVRGGMKKMKRREKARLDQVSATLILQSYLTSSTL